ncbi:protein MEI2-like 4 isoform X3 [Musa acuminata AAA Group]|uniref:protein MEI2-like 4 isoform X3 n=1 Tax=Musa acuminata AAA Group TaxID=214697 RepID=UPI0031D5B422
MFVCDLLGIEGIQVMSGVKSVSSSPFDELHKTGANSTRWLGLPQPCILKDQKTESSLEHCLVGPQRMTSISTMARVADHVSRSQSDRLVVPPLFSKGNLMDRSEPHHENGLFSSSLSDIFDRKLRLSSSIVPLDQSINSVNSNSGEDEPFESMEEIEAQTIGNLLPDDDDDLVSGVIDNIGYIGRPSNGNDIDDDIFYSGGGMELESDDSINVNRTSESVWGGTSNGQQEEPNGPFAGEHPYGEHPSRTLFVRNINSNVEDGELRALFEQYGDIRMLYTTCKHRGFVMISYYDIRAARNAMRALQNKPLRRRKLDIHFSIPKDNPSDKDMNQGTLVVFNLDSSVTRDDLRQIFGIYGEIKEIRETPHKHHHKFIEFYDVRAAEAALRALNRSDIAGKKIKLEPSRAGGARHSLMQQLSPELVQEELTGCWQGSPKNSLPGCFGLSSLGTIIPNSLENGAIQGLNSAVRAPFTPLMGATFHGISSSVPQNLSPPVKITSISDHTNQATHADVNHSMGQMNFGFQGIAGFHPHSVSEYHNGVTNFFPYISNTMSPVGIGVISRPSEGIDKRRLHKLGSGSFEGHSFDPNEAFGVSSNGSCPLHGHQHVWNDTNAYHQKTPSTMLWSNSPFISNIPAHHPSQIHGIPRAHSHTLNTVLPLHHHVGSAPSVDPSLWNRRPAYSGDSIKPPAFHPASLGSMGLSTISQLKSLELASCNIFSHSGGNCLDPCISPAHVGIASPQQRGQMFHGRNPVVHMPASFDGPDRIKNRRNDTNTNQCDNKKQYELDIESIICGEDSRTTLMIKNIPNKYTSKMLLAAIDENHRGTYDFIYLPIDFKNKCNVGYAFINMINPQHIIWFYQSFNGKKWEKFNSEKVASLAYARIQGKMALIAHFQNSSLMNEDKRCRPILFHTDGPNAGDQEPFPVGTSIRSRSGNSRTVSGGEENHQGCLSTSTNGEASWVVSAAPGSTKDSE